VKIEAREGQYNESETKQLAKLIPRDSSDCTAGTPCRAASPGAIDCDRNRDTDHCCHARGDQPPGQRRAEPAGCGLGADPSRGAMTACSPEHRDEEPSVRHKVATIWRPLVSGLARLPQT
jgi:hypothetical protein